MQRKPEQGRQVGIGLLLAGSDAFKELADEIAAAHQRWEAAGGDAATLEWAQRLAELAAWWCGRLEGEADAVLASDQGMDPLRRGRCRTRGRHG
jgi:hypothetical protein